MRQVAFILFGTLVLGAEAQQKPDAPLPDQVQFNRDIRPILSENCVRCHGPNAKDRKGGLRLDTKEGAFAESESGKLALVPGSLEKSELWRRVSTSDAEEKMPPRKSGKKLTSREAALLKRWIEQGARPRAT